MILLFAAAYVVGAIMTAFSPKARINWQVAVFSEAALKNSYPTLLARLRFFGGVALLWPMFLYLWREMANHSQTASEIDEEWHPLISAKLEDLRYEISDHLSEEYADAMGWLRDQHKEGDQVWRFSTSQDSWGHLAGRSGFVLIRNGEIVAEAVTLMN